MASDFIPVFAEMRLLTQQYRSDLQDITRLTQRHAEELRRILNLGNGGGTGGGGGRSRGLSELQRQIRDLSNESSNLNVQYRRGRISLEQYEQATRELTGRMGRLSQNTDLTGDELARLNRLLLQTEGRLEGAARRAQGLGLSSSIAAGNMQLLRSAAASVGAAVASIGVARGAGSLLSAAGDAEQTAIAFETLLGSAQRSERFLKDLYGFAATTPFEIAGVERSVQRLIALGVSAEDTLPTLGTLGDAMSALGGGQAELDGVVRAIGQIQTKGRVQSQELLQLAERGIPAFDILAEKLGLTGEEVSNIGKLGISASEGIGALLEGLDERFGGAMEAQLNTVNGLLSNLQDNISLTARNIGTQLVNAFDVKDGIKRFTADIAGLQNLDLAPTFQAITFGAQSAGVALGLFATQRIPAAVAAIRTLSAAAFASPFAPLIAGAVALTAAYKTNFAGIRDVVNNSVSFVSGKVQELASSTLEAAGGADVLRTKAGFAFSSFGDIVENVTSRNIQAIQNYARTINDFAPGADVAFASVGSGVQTAMSVAATALSEAPVFLRAASLSFDDFAKQVGVTVRLIGRSLYELPGLLLNLVATPFLNVRDSIGAVINQIGDSFNALGRGDFAGAGDALTKKIDFKGILEPTEALNASFERLGGNINEIGSSSALFLEELKSNAEIARIELDGLLTDSGVQKLTGDLNTLSRQGRDALTTNKDLGGSAKELAETLESAGSKTRTAADVIQDLNDVMASAPKIAQALGDGYDATDVIINQLKGSIEELIKDFGFSPSDAKILELIQQLGEYSEKAAQQLGVLLEARLEGTQTFTKKLEAYFRDNKLPTEEIRNQLVSALEGVTAEIRGFGPLDSPEKIAAYFNLQEVRDTVGKTLSSLFGAELTDLEQIDYRLEVGFIGKDEAIAQLEQMRNELEIIRAESKEAGNFAAFREAGSELNTVNSRLDEIKGGIQEVTDAFQTGRENVGAWGKAVSGTIAQIKRDVQFELSANRQGSQAAQGVVSQGDSQARAFAAFQERQLQAAIELGQELQNQTQNQERRLANEKAALREINGLEKRRASLIEGQLNSGNQLSQSLAELSRGGRQASQGLGIGFDAEAFQAQVDAQARLKEQLEQNARAYELFGDGAAKAEADTRALTSTIDTLLASGADDSVIRPLLNDLQALQRQTALTEARAEYVKLRDAIAEATGNGANRFDALIEQTRTVGREAGRSTEEIAGLVKSLEKAKSAKKLSDTLGQVQTGLSGASQLFSLFAENAEGQTKRTLQNLGDIVDGLGGVADGITQIASGNIVGGIIGIVSSVVGAITSIFKRGRDEQVKASEEARQSWEATRRIIGSSNSSNSDILRSNQELRAELRLLSGDLDSYGASVDAANRNFKNSLVELRQEQAQAFRDLVENGASAEEFAQVNRTFAERRRLLEEEHRLERQLIKEREAARKREEAARAREQRQNELRQLNSSNRSAGVSNANARLDLAVLRGTLSQEAAELRKVNNELGNTIFDLTVARNRAIAAARESGASPAELKALTGEYNRQIEFAREEARIRRETIKAQEKERRQQERERKKQEAAQKRQAREQRRRQFNDETAQLERANISARSNLRVLRGQISQSSAELRDANRTLNFTLNDLRTEQARAIRDAKRDGASRKDLAEINKFYRDRIDLAKEEGRIQKETLKAQRKQAFTSSFSIIDGAQLAKDLNVSFDNVIGLAREKLLNLAQGIGQALEGGVNSGFGSAIDSFLKGGNLDALKEGIFSGISNAVQQAVIQGTLVKGALGSALGKLTETLATGDFVGARKIIDGIASSIPAITSQLEKLLAPLSGIGGSFGQGLKDQVEDATQGASFSIDAPTAELGEGAKQISNATSEVGKANQRLVDAYDKRIIPALERISAPGVNIDRAAEVSTGTRRTDVRLRDGDLSAERLRQQRALEELTVERLRLENENLRHWRAINESSPIQERAKGYSAYGVR